MIHALEAEVSGEALADVREGRTLAEGSGLHAVSDTASATTAITTAAVCRLMSVSLLLDPITIGSPDQGAVGGL